LILIILGDFGLKTKFCQEKHKL